MRHALAILLVFAFAASVMPTTVTARSPEQQALYDAYKQRRANRRAYALQTRRSMNAGKVHVYRTAVVVNVPVAPRSAIQQGWVWQPPIPRRRTLVDVIDDYTSTIITEQAGIVTATSYNPLPY